MEKSNKGKVVVVTGATAGVGRAVVTEFARQGAHIGLIARGRDDWRQPSAKWRSWVARRLCFLPMWQMPSR